MIIDKTFFLIFAMSILIILAAVVLIIWAIIVFIKEVFGSDTEQDITKENENIVNKS